MPVARSRTRYLLAIALMTAFGVGALLRLAVHRADAQVPDVPPSLSINDVSVQEGGTGTTSTATFTVTLSQAAAGAVTVDYATADGSAPAATAGQDYVTASGTVTFNPGDLTKTIGVTVNGDPFDEFDESFVANLSNASGATIADAQGVGTILDDDLPPSVTIANSSVTEGTGGTTDMTFPVSLSIRSGKAITVDYVTLTVAASGDTAVAPDDYTATNGTLTFNPGDLSKTVTVSIVPDSLDEANETFTVHLFNKTNAQFAKQDATGTINDDDPAPSLSVNDVSLNEGDSGTVNATFTITLSAASGKTVTVNAATGGGTATSGVDYTAVTAPTITFNPGETTKTVNVPVIGDTLYETNETFNLVLSGATNASLGDASGVGTIANDDPAPSVAIDDVSATEGDTGTVTATFTVTLSPASGATATVNYTTVNGTAVAPSDFASKSGTLTFTAGQTSKQIAVTVNGDTTDEADEQFVVHLSSPSGATIADADGVGTILDDDPAPTVSLAGPVTVTEGDSGTTNATFTVNLSKASGKAITVDYATSDGTATAPSDYTAASGTLSFAVGDTSKTFTVLVNGDVHVEPTETFTVSLSNPTNATIGTGSATGTITNDDTAPTISINDVTVTEGNTGTTNATFTVSLSKAAPDPASVDYATADGTATAPGDYTSTSGTLSFAEGDSSKSITVPVVGDGISESNETFAVDLSNAVGATIADAEGVGTITDDDGPTASINDVSVAEGGTATFTATLAAASAQTVTIDYATADGTAAAGLDYASGSGTVTFVPGDTTESITVATIQDTFVEPSETFAVNLSNPSGATLADAQGIGTILDDDLASISINDVSVTEGDSGTTNATFTVSLSQAALGTVTVDYATADGTATAPADYASGSGTLTFNAGDSSKTVTVAVNGDTLDEDDETFVVNLASPTNGVISDAQGVGTIVDNDLLPKLSVGNVSVTEGTGGTTTAAFTVSLSPASGRAVTVNYGTVDGTATAPGDYTSTSGLLTFNAGDTSKTVNVPIATDSLDEPDEAFVLHLFNKVNAAFDKQDGTGTILDDDAAPTLSVSDVTAAEGNSGSTAFAFTVSLSAASGKSITVTAATSNGTATAGSDYVALPPTTVTLNPGDTAMTVNVSVIGDTLYEANETFSLGLSSPVNATLAKSSGVATITNDDAQPTLSINDVSVTEGNSGTANATFTISLSTVSGLLTQVDFATANGTAIAPDDYQSTTGTKILLAGDTSATVTVPVNGDTTDEEDETFFVNLSAPSNASIADGQGQGTIVDDDAPPTVSLLAGPTVNEGNSGTTDAVFTIKLSAVSGKSVSVHIATADGTATAPSDYTFAAFNPTFAPGDTTKTFTVKVNGDVLVEPDETFTASLSSPVNATIGIGQATATIKNDDTGPAFSINDVSVTEGGQGSTKTASFTVTLSPTATTSVTISYATADGSASSGPQPNLLTGQSDYVAKTGTLTFSAGTKTKTIGITVKGDALQEPDETFFVNLSDPSAGTALLDAQGMGTIKNDEAAGACTVIGSNNADVINGTPGDDVLCGGGGNDTINGLGGIDTLKGDAGTDILDGGDGDDSLHGGDGNDTLYGEGGNDQLNGDGGPDTMYGGDGNDNLSGGGGNDKMYGDAGDDILHGNDNDDAVVGGDGADHLYGDGGNDNLDSRDGVSGNDSNDGGIGLDSCQSDTGDTRNSC